MNEAEAASALRDALWLTLKLGGPLLLLALVIGLVVSLLQAVTQVNEPTLAFLPKAVILGAAMAILGPFFLQQLTTYQTSLMDRVIQVGGR